MDIFASKRLEFTFGWGIDFENNNRDLKRHSNSNSNVFVKYFSVLMTFVDVKLLVLVLFPN